VPAVNQQMGRQIHGRRHRRIGEPPLTGRQADHKQGSRRRNDTQSHRSRPAERKSFESRLWEAASGKTASDVFYQHWCKI
jgi:hypothetical protein